ncbi:putative transcriptional regulator, XRE family [Pseudogulbenkiania sp. NH8B]|uniref:helix-turn-helix domain-containing protein n=1 Tax=Pseudogulbenkiania sp. (strain NH8B) TaxID=748280 RepID=UPI0002279A77|nr:transcriptional regulator [Pseudogulbenkiania sp. NH8B]BAK75785.1 putative transcriptional regulator, XRE family [Pseudogulbenkiania sp. NH8B]
MATTHQRRRELFVAGSMRDLRRYMGLNQAAFWSAVGATQSAGSRYESGRRTPKPILDLIRVVHVEGIKIARLQRNHVPEEMREAA